MAEITKDSTLREVLKDYAVRNKRDNTFISQGVKFFKDIADEKGSAVKLFTTDKDGKTFLSKRLAEVPKDGSLKQPMQNLRQVGLSLKRVVSENDELYKTLPDKETSTPKNLKIFGLEEPPKPKSFVSINPNPEVLRELFEKIAEFKKVPELEAVADATLFNLQNGLRPNAAAGLRVDGSYFPDSGSIYISSEASGAKGRMISIPLSGLSDAILQDRIRNNKVKDVKAYKKGKINYATGKYFFVKPNGKVVDASDMTALLKRVKVKKILFDQKTEKHFDTLAPLDKDAPGKKGSAFFRNIHTQLAGRLGVPIDRAAYLQGRSTVGLAKGKTGDITTYDVSFPGGVDPKGLDAQYANTISDVFAPSAKKYGYDISGKVPRITTQTEGFSNYFDAPVQDKAPDVQTVHGEPSKGLKDKLAKFGVALKGKGPLLSTLGAAILAPSIYEQARAANIKALREEGLKPLGDESDPSLRAKISKVIGPSVSAGLETAAKVLDPGVELAVDAVDTAGAYAKRAREAGFAQASSEFGLARDQDFVKSQNIQRQQRLADRVKRNTSVTPPPQEGFINQN